MGFLPCTPPIWNLKNILEHSQKFRWKHPVSHYFKNKWKAILSETRVGSETVLFYSLIRTRQRCRGTCLQPISQGFCIHPALLLFGLLSHQEKQKWKICFKDKMKLAEKDWLIFFSLCKELKKCPLKYYHLNVIFILNKKLNK